MDNELQFAHIEYSIQTKSIDIFNIGCGNGITNLNDPCYDGCRDCCNPELRNWNLKGKDALQVISKVVELTTKYNNLIDKIILVGGDPVDAYKHYPEEYLAFVQHLKTLDKPIYLFTRYELENLPVKLIENVDYVKTGPYIPELTCDDNIQMGIKLATSNQRIYKASEIQSIVTDRIIDNMVEVLEEV